MLQLDIILSESYDETQNEFVTDARVLQLEHSLVSLSKWESKYEKPFLSQNTKTPEEIRDYIEMMDLGTNTPPEVFENLTNDDFMKINAYMNAKQTATWFNERGPKRPNSQAVTSELLYYWLTSYEIPWVVETWHLSRLFTLIKVFNEERGSKDTKTNKRSGESMASERQRLNAERKAQMNTSG